MVCARRVAFSTLPALSAGLDNTSKKIIKVHLLPDADNSDQLPLWELDDGIIEGTLLSRYSSMKEVIIERIQSADNKDEFCRYNLVLSDDN